MIDLNTDSWARVAADKSKKNTHKTELGLQSGSRLPWLFVFLARPSPFVREWRDVNVRSAAVTLTPRLWAPGQAALLLEPAGCSLWWRGVNVPPGPHRRW